MISGNHESFVQDAPKPLGMSTDHRENFSFDEEIRLGNNQPKKPDFVTPVLEPNESSSEIDLYDQPFETALEISMKKSGVKQRLSFGSAQRLAEPQEQERKSAQLWSSDSRLLQIDTSKQQKEPSEKVPPEKVPGMAPEITKIEEESEA